MVTKESFIAAYLAAQPADVKKLMQTQSQMERQAMAQQLVAKGFKIDNSIMVWDNDAYDQTISRLAYGYTWVPSAGQGSLVEEPPGVTFNGQKYDPTVVPAGAIIVTLDEAALPGIFKAPVGVAE